MIPAKPAVVPVEPLLIVLDYFRKANWPDTKVGNAAYQLANALAAAPSSAPAAVPVGELRWLIERTYAKGEPAERREFWLGLTGNNSTEDSFYCNPEIWSDNAMDAARFSSESIAIVLRYRHFHPESTVEVCEHVFQCGTTAAHPAPAEQTDERVGEQLTHTRSCGQLSPTYGERCTCALAERIQIQTVETLLAAWQKRAYEAEAALSAPKTPQAPEREVEPTDAMIERMRHLPAVSDAMDRYAAAIKRWGVQDDTPLRVLETETAMLKQIWKAALARPLEATSSTYKLGSEHDMTVARTTDLMQHSNDTPAGLVSLTTEMIDAGMAAYRAYHTHNLDTCIIYIYRAMRVREAAAALSEPGEERIKAIAEKLRNEANDTLSGHRGVMLDAANELEKIYG